MKTLLICCSIAFLFLAGCTTIDFERTSMNKVSARNIGNNLKSSDITVTDVEAWVFGSRWKATTPDGTVYNCSSDKDLRRVNCVMITKTPTVHVESDQTIKKDVQVEGFGDFYTELKKLKELKDSGIITEDEFQTLKKKIIDRY